MLSPKQPFSGILPYTPINSAITNGYLKMQIQNAVNQLYNAPPGIKTIPTKATLQPPRIPGSIARSAMRFGLPPIGIPCCCRA